MQLREFPAKTEEEVDEFSGRRLFYLFFFLIIET